MSEKPECSPPRPAQPEPSLLESSDPGPPPDGRRGAPGAVRVSGLLDEASRWGGGVPRPPRVVGSSSEQQVNPASVAVSGPPVAPVRKREKPLRGIGVDTGAMRPIRPNAIWGGVRPGGARVCGRPLDQRRRCRLSPRQDRQTAATRCYTAFVRLPRMLSLLTGQGQVSDTAG